MSSEQANNNPGLYPIKGQWSGPCSQVTKTIISVYSSFREL